MVHASLFSGIGGPEIAAAMMGWENAFHCEINPFGRAVLEYWFPESKSYEDITKTDFREWRGKIDIITAGFPCQPFSYAGKRGGDSDARYLWPEAFRAIDEIRPTWFVGENVAGIATMVEAGILTPMGWEGTLFGEVDGVHRFGLRQPYTIERICGDLEKIGYSVQPVLIPAAAVGAPHRRDRIFFLAHNDRDHGGGERKGREQYDEEGINKHARCRRNEDKDNTSRTKKNERESVGSFQRPIENPVSDGRCQREHGQQRNQRNIRNSRAGDDERLCTEEGVYASNSAGRGCPTQEEGRPTEGSGGDGYVLPAEGGLQAKRVDGLSPIQGDAPDTHGERGGEIHEHVQPGFADGSEPFSNGRKRPSSHAADIGLSRAAVARAEEEICGEMEGQGYKAECCLPASPAGRRGSASHADRQGREEPQQPRRGEDSPEEEAGLDDRTVRPRRDESFADTYASRLSAAGKSRVYDEEERHDARRPAGLPSYDAWAEGSWWDNFPTISPVHAGNDGIPFRMDRASLPASMQPKSYRRSDPSKFNFGKWRTESLKAYGNAIVPQVMYRIFRAIEGANNKQ